MTGWRFEPLGPNHDRAGFRCGVAELDVYLQRQARQDVERRLAAAFVMTLDSKHMDGFYTLSAQSLLATELPETDAKKLPRFPLPVTLLGRMAVNVDRQGQGLGGMLLLDAMERAWKGARQIASWAMVVDAKVGAREFYLKYQFRPLPQRPERLFLPMATIDKLFQE